MGGLPGIKQLLSLREPAGWQRQLLPQKGDGGLPRGTCPAPRICSPLARQATPSIMDEASFAMAGLQTGDLGLLSSLVLALSGLSGVLRPGDPGEMGQRPCKT